MSTERAGAPVWPAWSGGKDSVLALHALRGCDVGRGPEAPRPVAALLTTVTEGYDRISMHGVRRELLHAQAAATGLPLVEVFIPPQCVNAVYEARMGETMARARAAGIEEVAFGDLFLEDVRGYRERQLAVAGMRALFPLWALDTAALARRFVALGFRAWVVCVDTQRLDASFVGRAYDDSFLADLPPGVDSCGERGEFHTFVWDGPVFARPVACRPDHVELRDGRFAFCELLDGTA